MGRDRSHRSRRFGSELADRCMAGGRNGALRRSDDDIFLKAVLLAQEESKSSVDEEEDFESDDVISPSPSTMKLLDKSATVLQANARRRKARLGTFKIAAERLREAEREQVAEPVCCRSATQTSDSLLYKTSALALAAAAVAILVVSLHGPITMPIQSRA